MTYDASLRTRVRELLDEAGRSPSSVAKGIGWAESTLLRKLDTEIPLDDSRYRPLSGRDVDMVLAEIGAHPRDLLLKKLYSYLIPLYSLD